MLERTLVFVDTSYLLASFYNSWENGARSQLEIDLPEVVRVLHRMSVNQLDQPVHRQNWYDGIPDSGPHRYQRALRSEPGVQLRAGQLIEWGSRRTQKGVDTLLVADMVKAALTGTCSDIILVSGDADMIPGVVEAVAAGVRVHLYGFGWDSMSSNLRFACDSTTILDPREDFRDCMRLEVLEGPVPAGGTCSDEPCTTVEGPDADVDLCPETDVVVNAVVDDDVSPTAPEALARHKPLGDAEPVEDLGGTCVIPDVRPAPPAPVDEPGRSPKPGPRPTPRPGPAPQAADLPPTADVDPAATPVPAPAPTDSSLPPAPLTPGGAPESADDAPARPNPSMMAPRRRLRSRYIPLPSEVWQSSGEQSPFDVGEQYAVWWYDHAATTDQREDAHTLTGGGLPPAIDRPLVQFACQTLHEFTLTENQRVRLRDGFHSGIRGILLNPRTR